MPRILSAFLIPATVSRRNSKGSSYESFLDTCSGSAACCRRTAGEASDVKDSSYRTVGYVKDNGTVQDSAYRTIGHASDLPRPWVAYYFFFSETLH